VVTTTDYLPGHSEKLTIKTAIDPAWGSEKVDFSEQIQWPHNGVRYGGPKDAADKQLTRRLPDRLKSSLDSDPSGVVKSGAETRAAVALLSRSIRIVSEGDQAGETFDTAARRTECESAQAEVPGDRGEALPPVGNKFGCYYFGAHMVMRQGFKTVEIRGVEFNQMGQGGRPFRAAACTRSISTRRTRLTRSFTPLVPASAKSTRTSRETRSCWRPAALHLGANPNVSDMRGIGSPTAAR
jgi:cell migration-inducing and hyaluronan-binding protein